jgi:uncharacterized repeat protein (TIGR02543 family)
MKVKVLSILAALTLFVTCENPFVSNILPDKNGNDGNVPPGSFVVTFDKNGGDTEASPRTKIVTPPATKIDALPAQPTRANHTFTGWNTQANGSGSAFTATTPVTANITVYAQWSYVPPGSFTVTFNRNGGDTDANPASKVVTPPETNVGTLPAPPVRTNHTFAGWNTQANGSGSGFTATTPVTASITVYAQWTPLTSGPTTAIVDFENDSLGYTYNTLSGAASQVVADPVNAGQKSLRVTSSNYNQAVIIPINLTAALNTAESFSFKFNLTNGTLSYKRILVYISGSAATFVDGAFGNEANNPDGYPEFAAYLLGRTEEINEPAPNQWHEYTISITGASLNNAIANLTGTAYLAIGINHGTNEGITYLLDDLTFTFSGGGQPTEVPPIVDFEADALNKTYGFTEGNNAPTSVKVVADPSPAGGSTKSLEFTGTSGHNQAAVIPINLPNALNTYRSFTFRFNMKTGSLDDKDMMVYVARNADTFSRYGFGNPSNDQHNFAANLLGKVTLTDVKNRWDAYEILITNPGSAISTLDGNVYIAIGINHNDAITYYLDDLTFSDALPANFPTLVTFEDDAIDKTYNATSGTNSPTSVAVAVDPAHTNQKSLKVVTNGNGNAWNQAAIIPINVPDALSTYLSFTFRFNLQTAGTLYDNDQPRKINIYVADDRAKFTRYGFGNPAGNDNQFVNLLLGEVEPDYGETGEWVDYALNFTSPGSAISALTGNVYVAIGINHGTSITYYLDDLTFSKTEVQKTVGANLAGTLAVTSVQRTSVIVNADNAVTVSSPNGQVIEYAVSTDATAPLSGWQEEKTLTVAAGTTYYAYARAKANSQFYAGTAISSASFTTPAKDTGVGLTGPITEIVPQKKHNRIVINAVTAPSNGQTVEYAISTDTTEPATGWQDSTTFSGLDANTGYYVWARAKENGDYHAGEAIRSASQFTTSEYTEPLVPPTIVDFEADAVNKTYERATGGQGNFTATVVVDPVTSEEKSLRMVSSSWNNGALIPINLPFALENYQTFTFRYYLNAAIPESNRGNGIFVYVMSSTSGLNTSDNRVGNDGSFVANRLLANVVPDYDVVTQWVNYEVNLTTLSTTVLTTINSLQGDIYLLIGMNSGQTITYYLDDLTFNIKDEFVPTPSISPITATFDLNTSNTAQHKDIEVTVNLYGNTLSSIKNGDDPLEQDDAYTVSGSTVTLNTAYLNELTVGTKTLTFTFSGGTTKTIVITVRDSSGSLLMYTFNNVDPGVIVSNTSDFNVAVTGNVLRVTFNTTYSNRTFALPFKLPENETLADYWGIRMRARRVSGDINNSKTMRAEAKKETPLNASGSNLVFGSVAKNPLMPGTGEWTYIDIPRASGAAANSLSGEMYIGFYVDNSTQFVYEIESIELCKTQPPAVP